MPLQTCLCLLSWHLAGTTVPFTTRRTDAQKKVLSERTLRREWHTSTDEVFSGSMMMDGLHPIDFNVMDSERPSNEGSVIEVEAQAPHRIKYASQEWLDIFQLSKEEILGRTLMIIAGPATNLQQLKHVIATAAEGKEARGNVFCYSRAGLGKNMVVRGSPSSSGHSSTCFLVMAVSDAVPLKDAVFGEDAARAIVSASHPHAVEHVNARFGAEFGFTLEMVSGKTLRMIHGPRTDVGGFQALLQEARAGFSRGGVLRVYSKECAESERAVRVVPLIGHCGDISHLMAVFTPPPPPPPPPHHPDPRAFHHHPLPPPGFGASHGALPVQPRAVRAEAVWGYQPAGAGAGAGAEAGLEGEAAGREPSGGASGLTAHAARLSLHSQTVTQPQDFGFPPAPSPTPAIAAASAEGEGAGGEAERVWGGDGSATLRLVPRKKRITSADGSGALELTVQKLQDMGRISMKQAAQRLGIAPSTLKKACRKLGVERWPHGAHSEHASRGGKALDYDASYVRRLFNKYDKKPDETDTHTAHSDPAPATHPHHFASSSHRHTAAGEDTQTAGAYGLYRLGAEGHWPAASAETAARQAQSHGLSPGQAQSHGLSPGQAQSHGLSPGHGAAGEDDGAGKARRGQLVVASGREEGEGEGAMMEDVCALLDAAVEGLRPQPATWPQQYFAP